MNPASEPGGLRPIERGASVSARAAQQLLEAIVTGVFAVGDRLPSEQELARRLAVSRPSVREALSALQFAGYVESRRGSGAVVVACEPSVPFIGHPALVHADDVIDLLEARLVLEPQVVMLAAVNPEPAALGGARELIEGMRLVTAEPQLPAGTDLRVHVALIEICRNPVLVRECRRLLESATGPRWEDARAHAWSDRSLPELWASHHAAVYAAIAAGEPAEAERASRDHLVSVTAHLLDWASLGAQERTRLHQVLRRFTDRDDARRPREHRARR